MSLLFLIKFKLGNSKTIYISTNNILRRCEPQTKIKYLMEWQIVVTYYVQNLILVFRIFYTTKFYDLQSEDTKEYSQCDVTLISCHFHITEGEVRGLR